MPLTPWFEASSAAPTVPDVMMDSNERFSPILIPLTTIVGLSLSAYSPMITASVGLPATAHAGTPFSTTWFARSGSKIEIDLPTALCWVAGATTVTSAMGTRASYAAQSPTELTPSSLVSRMEGLICIVSGFFSTHKVGDLPLIPFRSSRMGDPHASPTTTSPVHLSAAGRERDGTCDGSPIG